MSKPTIIVVPGAWQRPAAFEEFVKKLQDAGYPTELVPLLTVGGTEPLAGLEDDVAAVQATLKKVAGEGKKALIVCHSAGGLVASNAVSGFADNVAGIIFMTAFMIPAGKAILEMLGGNPLPWMVIESDRVSGVPEMLPQVGFNDLSPATQERWAKDMTYTSIKLFASPSTYEPWRQGVKCGYIFCSEDNALPLPIQQGMAAQLGPEPATVTLKSGHCPHLSMPDELVEAVGTLESLLV